MKKLLLCTLVLTSSAMQSKDYMLRGHPTLGQSGDLDPHFNGTGIISAKFPNLGTCTGSAVGLGPDNKIVIGGYGGGSQTVIALGRYNQDGSLDTKFGHNGFIEATIGNSNANCNALAVQPDSKIVVVGINVTPYNATFALIRFNANGTIDSSFGNDGIVLTKIGYSSEATAVVLQPDGKIIVAGNANGITSNEGQYCFALARYNTNGSIDKTFGTYGITTTPIGNNADATATGIVLRSNGKIVVTGYANGLIVGNEDENLIALAQYTQDGKLDQTFKNHGIVTTEIANDSDAWIESSVLQPDDKIIVAGHADGGDNSLARLALARYKSDGTLDATFGKNGIVITEVDSVTIAHSVQLQFGGSIILAGETTRSNESSSQSILVRYKNNGSLDTSFGDDGIVRTRVGISSMIQQTTIQPDSRIVVVGLSQPSINFNGFNFVLARYLP